MTLTATARSPGTRRRDALVLALCLAAVLAGLVGLAQATGWSEIAAAMGRLTIAQVGILLVLSLVNYGARGLRWHVFARRLGLPLDLRANLRHFLGGFAMSVTPGRVGELVRMRWIYRETGWPVARTAPLALVDRASDLAAMALILFVTLALAGSGIAGGLPVALAGLGLAVIATRPGLVARLGDAGYALVGRWPRLFARVRSAARSLARFAAARVLLPTAALGLVGWIAEGVGLWLLLTWMGAPISPALAIAIFTFATLVGGLTGLPGGVGGAEAAMIALLAARGVPLEVAVPATAIIRLTTLWFALGIGLVLFPRAEAAALRSRA